MARYRKLIQTQNQTEDDSQFGQSKVPTAKPQDVTRISGVASALFTIFLLIGILAAVLMDNIFQDWIKATFMILWSLLALYFLFALKVAQQWEKAIVLRLGRFKGLKGPGMFWIIPIIDATPVWIDHRVMVTPLTPKKRSPKIQSR